MEIGSLTIEDLKAPLETQTAKVVKPVGSLDESNVDKLSKQIYEIIEKSPHNLFLLFDLTKLEYLNSKSIGYFTDWYSRISQGGGKIVIANAADNILDILDNVGLLDLVPHYKSFEEAQNKLFE